MHSVHSFQSLAALSDISCTVYTIVLILCYKTAQACSTLPGTDFKNSVITSNLSDI